MRHTFTSEQHLSHPLEVVFAFFADPANLPRLMPTWQDARIDAATYTPPPPPPRPFPGADNILAGTGSTMTLTIRPVPFSPVRLPWVAVIEDFRWPEADLRAAAGFCDVQLRGPFKYWRHCHTVTATPSGTKLIDHVVYEPPFGPFGTLANALFLRRQLAATFAYRQRRTLELLAQQ